MSRQTIYDYCNNSSKRKVILHIFLGFLVFLFSDLVNSILFDIIFSLIIKSDLPIWVYASFRSTGNIILFYTFFSLYLKKVIHLPMSDFRINKFNLKKIFVVCAIALPTFVAVCLMASGGTLIDNKFSTQEIVGNVIVALSLAITSGILEEMFFRGYLMKFLEVKWNRTIAILLP